jgi:Zn-dependent M28 family amino/carboxypeptidase
MTTLRAHAGFAFLFVAAACASGQSAVASPRVGCPVIPALDSAALMTDVFRLAADSMRGRRTGTPENARARDFIAARFDALGLGVVGPGRLAPFTITSTRRPQPITGTNVIGVIRGSRFPDRYIVVSAHFDHIGVTSGGSCRATGADSVCNGADDNASGTAALLQLARHFSVTKPQHSIIFAAFDAEESGDVGSQAWVDSMPVPVEQVLIDVNMDMIGRNAKNELFASGARKYPHLAPLVNATVGCAPAPITLISGHDGEAGRDDWTNQSDQGAFHRKGIPFIYFGEEDHPDYHRAGDHPDRLMPAFYVAAARLVGSFVSRFDANPVAKPK